MYRKLHTSQTPLGRLKMLKDLICNMSGQQCWYFFWSFQHLEMIFPLKAPQHLADSYWGCFISKESHWRHLASYCTHINTLSLPATHPTATLDFVTSSPVQYSHLNHQLWTEPTAGQVTFILQLLITLKGQAGMSNLKQHPKLVLKVWESILLQFSWAAPDGAEFPGLQHSHRCWFLQFHSWSFVPFYVVFQGCVNSTSFNSHQTSKQLGEQLDITEERKHLLKSVWHSCLPRLAWVPALNCSRLSSTW